MLITNKRPPNYAMIVRHLRPQKGTVFAYGYMLYNPSGGEIPEDVLVHEQVHERQMTDMHPDMWWIKYCTNSFFRERMEAEAFREQYQWVAKQVDETSAEMCLQDLAVDLSKNYKLDISFKKAYNIIYEK